MRRLDWSSASPAERRAALARPSRRRDARVTDTVNAIFADVAERGEAAVADWALKLDGAAPRAVEITPRAVSDARARVAPEDADALAFAADNIRRFHEADRPADGPAVEPVPGVRCRRVWRPIETAGLYVPGGTAPLFSTLLMLAIPAAAAGVPNRVAVTPPGKGGGVHPMMILAAEASGLDAITLAGGAQAIAALTLGAGLPRADKLFGPGNAYVAEAKRYAADLPGGPSIDLPAGPSELLVIADASADPTLVAVDLLSQAEHDADAQVVLVTPDPLVVTAVAAEIDRLLRLLPRAATARASLEAGLAVVCRNLDEALDVAAAYAPEHLSLQTREPEALVPNVRAAGTVFVGPWSAESFGDYLSGPSHVLPTDGAARTWSGVTVSSFMTSFAVQEADAAGAARLSAAAARLARLEGLEAHALAADLRSADARKAA